MGNFYQKINSPRPTNLNTPIYRIVTKKINKYKEELALRKFNNVRVTKFSQNNPAYEPRETAPFKKTYFTNTLQIKKIISTLPNKCSSGLDGIPQVIIKRLTATQVQDVTVILNNALNNKYFPKAWKCSKILPILRPNNNPHDPSSHRPTSLTPNTSKILEIIISNSIEDHSKNNHVMPDNQFGF